MFTQKFIKLFHSVQEIGPFSLFQNLALDKASTDDKCHFANPLARSFQHQTVCKILSYYSKRFKSSVSLFSEFEPRQNLNQSQMPFDNLMGYILPIPMCMQHFSTIFHSVQEIGPFLLFHNLELGKTSTDEKWHLIMKTDISQSLGLELVIINLYAEVYQNIPLGSRDKAIFTFSEFGARQSLDRW